MSNESIGKSSVLLCRFDHFKRERSEKHCAQRPNVPADVAAVEKPSDEKTSANKD